MAWKINLNGRRVNYYLRKIDKHTRRGELFAEYQEARSEKLAQKLEKRYRDFENRGRRGLESLELASDSESRFAAFREESLARERAKLRMKFRARRETLRRRAAKRPGTDVEGELARYQRELDARLEGYAAALDAEYAEFAAAARPVPEQRAEEEKTFAEELKAVEERCRTEYRTKTQTWAERSKKRTARQRKLAESARLKYRRSLDEARELPEIAEESVLKVEGLCMYFGGLHAVEDLSFEVKKGEIFGLIGPNGAGKTTVFNCITQFYKSTKGRIWFRNKQGDITLLNEKPVHDVILEGIVRTFQNVEVVREITVLENLLVAATRQYTSNLFEQMLHLPILKLEETVIRRRANRILEFMGLTPYRDMPAFGLPYGVLKKIEIARTLMANPQLIILDEPAAGLNDSETVELAALIRRIKAEYDCTILLVEHDMGLVMEICDRICAISFGKLLALGTPSQIQSDSSVQEAYLGAGDEV